MKKNYFILILILICCSLLLMGCAENPVSHENQFIIISDDDEILLGQEADLQIKEKFGVYNHPPLLAYVDSVGQKVAAVCDRPNIPYYFTILDTDIINAFALPGGYVYITRGMLAKLNSEAELANILAHEITHISARHGAQRLSQAYGYQLAWIGAGIILKQKNIQSWKQAVDLGVQLALLGYSRENEFEADYMGCDYAMWAGYTPEAMGSFLKTLKRDEGDSPEYLSWLSTHPPTNERIDKVDEHTKTLLQDISTTNLLVLSDEYKERINGLELGPGQTSGIINGRQYKNQYYGFLIIAPKNWQLSTDQNPALVTISDTDKKYTVYLQATILEKTLTLEEWMETIESAFGEKVRKIKGFPNQDKLQSYSAFYEEEVETLGQIIERRDYIIREKIGYIITYLARTKDYTEGTNFFDEVYQSFSFLSPEEMQKSYSQYLVIYSVQENDSIASIAEKHLGSANKDKRIIDFNSLDPNKPLYSGQKLKIPPKEKDT